MTTTFERPTTVSSPRRAPVPGVSSGIGRFRHQPPVYSPLSAGAVIRAAVAVARAGPDPRAALRETLCQAYQAPIVVLTGSGTQALQLAITAAARVAGAPAPIRVALPAFTCFDVATAAIGAGAEIGLYDVDPDTLSPDLDSLESVLAQGARVVVVTPLYGFPVDWPEIEARAARWGAVVVEDAAQGQGARWRGQPLGSLGVISVISFGRGKGWTACGGGAVLLRGNAGLEASLQSANVSRELGTIVSAVAQWLLARPSCYALPASLPFLALGETRYHPPEPPRAMTRAAAAIALGTRPDALFEAFGRRVSGTELMASLPETVVPVRVLPDAEPGFIRLPVRIRGGFARLASPERAMRLGVGRSYPSTLARLEPVRQRMRGDDGPWPGAQTLVEQLVTLPTHSWVSPRDQSALLAELRQLP